MGFPVVLVAALIACGATGVGALAPAATIFRVHIASTKISNAHATGTDDQVPAFFHATLQVARSGDSDLPSPRIGRGDLSPQAGRRAAAVGQHPHRLCGLARCFEIPGYEMFVVGSDVEPFPLVSALSEFVCLTNSLGRPEVIVKDGIARQ